VVVSASWCPPCQELEARLRSEHVPFKDVDLDSPAGARLADNFGLTMVPAVFVKTGDRYVQLPYPSMTAIRAALRRSEARDCDEPSEG
jgi:hypothetical protein